MTQLTGESFFLDIAKVSIAMAGFGVLLARFGIQEIGDGILTS